MEYAGREFDRMNIIYIMRERIKGVKHVFRYLVATGIDEGLPLNFGGTRLEYKKKFRIYKRENQPPC